ncbi:hypothetical protein AAG570_009924 [Ranatra chinensis]|uniref:Uncharacterized protein n=1 Tax=Ranatra chinensis TaxID=642074 RepID=A0ABD0YQT1_9HEMI
MASKRQNMFYLSKKQETTEIEHVSALERHLQLDRLRVIKVQSSMASKRRNMFCENKKQKITEIVEGRDRLGGKQVPAQVSMGGRERERAKGERVEVGESERTEERGRSYFGTMSKSLKFIFLLHFLTLIHLPEARPQKDFLGHYSSHMNYDPNSIAEDGDSETGSDQRTQTKRRQTTVNIPFHVDDALKTTSGR